MNDSQLAKFIRGLVKAVFIGCYIAFMWASIHKVAYFFGNFEADGGNGVGSYALAGAFDVTALVTTIGVMFFRRSMPRTIQVIVWGFIVGIVAYTFFINWEYDAHFQGMSLVLQPTGQTQPIYDQAGVLHYVPIMNQNTSLLFINPLLASGFTIFALIYSIVAEFFGTKPPSVEELAARKKYLEETESVRKEIQKLEESQRGKSFIEVAKEKALEVKSAIREVAQKEGIDEETTEETEEEPALSPERNTDQLRVVGQGIQEEILALPERKEGGKKATFSGENLPTWLSGSGTTIDLRTVVKHTDITLTKLRNLAKKGQIRRTKNLDIVYKDSLVEWMKREGYILEPANIVHLNPVRNEEETNLESVEN